MKGGCPFHRAAVVEPAQNPAPPPRPAAAGGLPPQPVGALARLRVWHKLLLLSLSFLLPIAVMFWLIVKGLNERIDFARLEMAGNEYQAALEVLLDLVPQHRLAGLRLPAGEANVRGDLAALEARIDQAFAGLEAVDARLGDRLQFTQERLAKQNREHARAGALKHEWQALKSDPPDLSPAAWAERHLHLIAGVRRMITQAGDTSNLILDPDLDSYYLMDVTLLALPQTQDRLAVIMAYGEEALRGSALSQNARTQLKVHAALLREADVDRITASTQTALNEDGNFYGVRPALQTNVPPALAAFAAAAGEFLRLTTELAEAERTTVTAEDFLAAGARARAASFQFWHTARGELDGLLQARIDHYARTRLQAETAVAFALAASVVFVVFITRSINGPLRRQAEALAGANEGLRTEVAERARAEESLRESEARVRAIVDSALDAVVTMDASGRIIGWNLQAEVIFGWKCEEAVGQSLSQTIVPPQHREAHERGLQRFLESGHGPVLNTRVEITAVRRDGQEFDVELAITPLRTQGGMEFSAFLRDISERKRAEEERQRLVNFLEASFNEVYVFDPASLRFSYVNQSALKNLGYSAEQMRQLTPLDLKPAFTAEAFRRMVTPLLNGTTPRHVFETFHRRADGTDYPVEVCLQIVAKGAEKVFLAVINDTTARKRTETELKKAHDELLAVSRQAGMAEVASGVLHNVGNVLNSVNVSANLVSDQVRKTPVADLGRVVTLLREQGANLGAFFTSDARGPKVPDFLASLAEKFTRQQENQLKEVAALQKNIEHIKDIVAMQQSYAKVSGLTENLSPAELIEDALRMNAGSFQKHEVELARELAADLPQVCVDKHKVLQILVNLLRNAKHACDDAGRPDKRITVRAISESGRVLITIADNGVGIAPENLNRIFNHGFTTKKEGHGFGLHSAANAAKEMGGSLIAHSDGPGCGATFTLDLPMKRATAEPAPAMSLPNAA